MHSLLNLLGLALAFYAFQQFAIAQGAAPDMILTGGRIITVDARDTVAEALAISRGRILAVGSTAQIRALAGSQTVAVDLAGRTVIPGLIDSHIHAIRDALYYTTLVDWGDVRDLNGALDSIRAAARKSGPGAWITVVGGWAKDQLREKRAPTPQELDAAAPDNPVFIQHLFDFAVLNSLAMKTLGITAQTNLPPAGKVLTDSDGVPTGLLREAAARSPLDSLRARSYGRVLRKGWQVHARISVHSIGWGLPELWMKEVSRLLIMDRFLRFGTRVG